MVSHSRRRALQCGAVVLSGSVAGCLDRFRSEPDPVPQFGDLAVINEDSSPATVSVFVLEDGDPVYHDRLEANAAEGNRLGGGEFDGYPTEPGQYEIYAWYDDQPRSEWNHIDLGDLVERYSGSNDTPCYRVRVRIESADDGDRRLSIWYGVDDC
ncbi:hypothetical protein ACLI4Q_07700 [Natrialbaceae archaeon A-CW1-1]